MAEAFDPDDEAAWAAHVPTAYDRIAAWWLQKRASRTPFWGHASIERLLAKLPARAHVLDVGCGGGTPVAVCLVEHGHRVTGIDASQTMIAHARTAVPKAMFVHGDMRSVEIDGPFDAVVAWDSVFHLPRADHAHVFERFAAWLRPGGWLLVSLGGSADEHMWFTSQMNGETFYYSGHEPEEALQLLERAGFAIEHWEVDDPASRGHITVLAERRPDDSALPRLT